MSKNNYFSVISTIELQFKNSQMRDISYTSFLPEFNKLQTKRSKVIMEKKNDTSLIFKIRSNDITAFRASINDIISFGKVITNSFEIVDNS
jgi:tRNA threonylcarbamoyladenosine modification (KEOPS) complex  Pcc1 subunit